VLEGRRTADMPVPAADVYAVVADVANYPSWQSLVDRVDVRESDAEGRPRVISTAMDAKVKVLRLVLRYAYDPIRGLSWTLDDGDVKDLRGSWTVEPAGEATCRVTYHVAVDPGRGLGLLIRGGTADRLRARIVDGTVDDLRRYLEARAA
jgi:ribosome-associated toxin RatA of RatAB toxin-antitoxin module